MLYSDPGIAARKRERSGRLRALAVGLSLAFVLGLGGFYRQTPLPVAATALIAAGIYLVYEGLDPLKASFLHHNRIRLIGAALVFAASLALAMTTAWPATAPMACAGIIAFRHYRSGRHLDLALASEMTQLKQKILLLETREQQARQQALALQSLNDKPLKAS